MQVRYRYFHLLILGFISLKAALSQNPQLVPCATIFTVAFTQQIVTIAAADTTDARLADLKGRQHVYLMNLASPATRPDPFLKANAPTLNQAIQDASKNALSSLSDAAQSWDQMRLDRDGGVTSNSTTSTDLVGRGGLTELLSAAVSLGGVSQTETGNAATLHINAGGLKSYLESGSVLDKLPSDSNDATKKKNRLRFDLHNLDAAVSFDLNSASTTTTSTSGPATTGSPTLTDVLVPSTSSRWSGVDVRYAISAPFDPNSKKFQDAWQQAFTANQKALEEAASAAALTLKDNVFAFSAADKTLADANALLFEKDALAGNPQKLASDFDTYCTALMVLLRSEHPEFAKAAAVALAAVNSFQEINREVVQQAQEINGYPLLVEYTYNRPFNQPATHVGRFILSGKKGMALYTANLAATVYDGTLPPGAKYGRFRDVQASAQIDRGFGANNVAVISGSFYYQYQQDPTVLEPV